MKSDKERSDTMKLRPLLPNDLRIGILKTAFDTVLAPTPGPNGFLERQLIGHKSGILVSTSWSGKEYKGLEGELTWTNWVDLQCPIRAEMRHFRFSGTDVYHRASGRTLLILDPCNWRDFILHEYWDYKLHGICVLTGDCTRKRADLLKRARILYGERAFRQIYKGKFSAREGSSKFQRAIEVYSSLEDTL